MFIHSSKNCNAKTFKTKCIYCGRTVFYFSCDCGCKIFFDELGGDWKRHYCEEYVQHAIKMQGNNDHPAIQNKLYDKISIALNDINIEEVCNIDTFKQIPDLVSIQDVGKIKHIETGIDIFKMFNEDKSDFNIASLAGLNFKKLSYITINIEDNLRGSTELYSGFINTSKLNNLSESDEVEFSIRGKSIFFNITVWIIDEIYPL